jgi:hypothetical protein
LWLTRLFKGDKGARDGKYLLLWEFDGPEKRDFSPQRRQERKDFLGDT